MILFLEIFESVFGFTRYVCALLFFFGVGWERGLYESAADFTVVGIYSFPVRHK